MNRPLTVLVVGRFGREAFALHIAGALEAMGHRVVRFEAGLRSEGGKNAASMRLASVRRVLLETGRSTPIGRRRYGSRLLRQAERQRVDLTLVCHDFLSPSEVGVLKRATRSPVCLWFPDAILNFGKCYFLNADYDALFFKDPYIVHRLRSMLSLPVHYLPECHDPAIHRPTLLTARDHDEYACDITTAGSIHSYRAAVFADLSDYDVKLWGNPPPLWLDRIGIASMLQNRFVAYEDKAKAFLAAKIVVNNLHPAEVWGVNCRTFEVAGIGAFQLVDWRPGLEQLFEDGREIVSFRGAGDLRDKIDHYLSRPEERAAIARRGLERARRDHTYELRLAGLLSCVLDGEAGFPMPMSVARDPSPPRAAHDGSLHASQSWS